MTPAPVPAPAPPAAKPATTTATQQTKQTNKPETTQVDNSIVSKSNAQKAFDRIYNSLEWDRSGKHPSGSGSVP